MGIEVPRIQETHSLSMFVCPGEEEVGFFSFLWIKLIPKVWTNLTPVLTVDLSGCFGLSSYSLSHCICSTHVDIRQACDLS